jgi:hypothetical protein
VVVDADVDLVLLVLAGVLDDVRARLGHREHDLLDPALDDAEVLEGLTQQSTHHRHALRVHRKADPELDVHARSASRNRGDLPSQQETR